jgi:hypothetical protein
MSREWEGELRPPGETPIEYELAEGTAPAGRLWPGSRPWVRSRSPSASRGEGTYGMRVPAGFTLILRAAAVSQHVRLSEVVRA